ncbi:MAG: DNA mismatch repair endonuclease MutL [Selenomonadaceae bacterium]|nr:DNA mismatch repair endonuclease MutL [Selenomonadaceae bacterium]
MIELLPEATINKIAAGEVVERPASVVKELIENAMDAKAKTIEVEIDGGGIGLIRVTDDGTGMQKTDAKTAILRHATSKLKDASDLSRLSTMGFRGEALPTIASVSKFSLLTRIDGEDFATAVEIVGGKPPTITEAGGRVGTTVKVEDLFFNTPARKKFLKTPRTEIGRANDIVMKLALARPDISFRLKSGGRDVLRTPGGGDLKETIRAVYGADVAAASLPLYFSEDEVSIRGFVTKPTVLRSSRAWQTFIVNGRVIENRAIARAIDNAYRALIPKSGYPLAVVVITLPLNSVDVNVHPQKTELKFEDESKIFHSVYHAVTDAIQEASRGLSKIAATAENTERHIENSMLFVKDYPKLETFNDAKKAQNNEHGENRPIEYLKREIVETKAETTNEATEPTDTEFSTANERVYGNVPAASADKRELAVIPIGQVDRCYIIAKDAHGLYIVDQHAAHERILFDRLSNAAENIPIQQLLVHIMLNFTPREAEIVEKNSEIFAKLGFTLVPSGKTVFRLTEIPADVPIGEAEDALREILVGVLEKPEVTAASIRKEALAITACRGAIKAGDELNLKQMEMLLDELSKTDYPYTCPHGRPTILKFSTGELDKMFKRTGF